MQASVTTVFRSAVAASSMPICSASPAIAWRTTATFSARAGSDICSPDGSTLVVLKFSWSPARRIGCCRASRRNYRPCVGPDTQTHPSQTIRASRRLAALACRAVGPAPSQASPAELEGGVQLVEVHGELDLSTATQLEGPLEEAVQSEDAAVLIDLADFQFIDSH